MDSKRGNQKSFWASYRRQGTGVAFLLGAIVLALPFQRVASPAVRRSIQGLGLLALGGFAVLWPKWMGLLCPRCHRPFHLSPHCIATRGRQCPHCGLERYAVPKPLQK